MSDTFVIGYGGWVKLSLKNDTDKYWNSSSYNIGGSLLQVTSASITRSMNVPTVNSYYLPFKATDGVTSPIKLGDGTYTFSGELSFELTGGVVSELFKNKLFKRGSWFAVTMFDGKKYCGVANCVWSSLTISCSAGGIASMSISYQSNNGYQSNLIVGDSPAKSFSYSDEDLLIPYWRCGHSNFLDFTVSFNRNVTPVFLNNDFDVPSYLRPGLIDVSLNATSMSYITNWVDTDGIIQVNIGSSHGIKINKPLLQSVQYSMSSMSDVGTKSYTWNSIGETSLTSIFSIF